MTINYVVGDMFDNAHRVEALAQECNIEGVMNTQISLGFRNRYPVMFQEYREKCQADPPELNLGDVFTWKSNEGLWILNLAVYENLFCKLASFKIIENAFREMYKTAEQEQIKTIGMSAIGAGLGGLYWGKSSRILERVFRKWRGNLYVYVKQPYLSWNR